MPFSQEEINPNMAMGRKVMRH